MSPADTVAVAPPADSSWSESTEISGSSSEEVMPLPKPALSQQNDAVSSATVMLCASAEPAGTAMKLKPIVPGFCPECCSVS